MNNIEEVIMPETVLDRKINIATATTRFALKWKNRSMTIGDFVAKLSKPTITQETVKEFRAMPKARQDDIKDVGGYVGGVLKGGRRSIQSVANRTILTLDLDHAGETKTEQLLDRVGEALSGTAWLAHSTHKHTDEAPRLRIISFLDRPAFPDEYEALARKIAEKINIEWFDDSTYEPHRLMYWPSIPNDAENVFADYTGEPGLISVRSLLDEYGPDELWKDTTVWPTSSRQAGVLERRLKQQADPLAKKGVIGAFCRTFTIEQALGEFLGEVYRHEGGNRWTYIEGSSSKGLVIYDGKFAYSNHSTDPSANQLCNAFDLVRIHRFGHLDGDVREDVPIHKTASFKAMSEFAEDIQAVKVEMVKNLFSDAAFDDVETDVAADDDWINALQTTKEGAIKPTYGNCCDILTYDEQVKDLVWHNEFTGLKEYGRGGREWSNEDTLVLRKYLRDKYGMDIPGNNCADAVDWKADKQRHHPVKEYLLGLNGTWDGVKRAEMLWIDYLGEEDNAYTRETAKCWLLAAVNRIMKPGYKFDYVPVIYGPQGVRKSTMCAVLAKNPDWFGELGTFEEQRAVEQMRGKWILEFAELSINNKSELEQQKHFISSTKSCVRLAYRRDPATFYRHCVFIGTTNQREYLKDTTGNRRWWPVDCAPWMKKEGPCIDLEKLKGEVDQIWAEVMEMYCDIDSETELSKEASEIARRIQEEKLEADEWSGLINSWIEEKAHRRRYDRDWDRVTASFDDDEQDLEIRDRVCVLEIWHDCLGMKYPIKKYDRNRIASVLDKNTKWERKITLKFGDRFGKQRGWIKTSIYAPF